MHHAATVESPLYGLMAEFADAHDLIHAAESARKAGYKKMDAFSPIPVHGLAEAIGFNDIAVPWIIFLSGIAGACGGLALEYYVAVIDNRFNIGGKPFFSWPNFIPPMYECTILAAAFGAVFGMLLLNGLPRPHHPVFNAPRFELASQDRFFLCIEAADPKFNREETEQFLAGFHPAAVSEIEN